MATHPASVPATSAAATALSPSLDVLTEAARTVGAAYPDLFAHQRTGVTFLLARRRAILADDMGLGKTRQAIIALREAAPAGRYLVVCPAGLKLNWAREIRLVEPGATIQVVAHARTALAGTRWTIVNYDLLSKLLPRLLAMAWGGIVLDEAHYLKNDSQRTKHVFRLVGLDERHPPAAEPEALYLLTGTPMASRPRDLFNLLRIVRHPVANSFFSYAKRYCAAYDNGYGLDTNGASNLEELAELIGGVLLRRTKDEALDLPPKVRTWQPVEIADRTVGQREARALGYLAEHPARSGPTWVTFLGLLNQARHALAVAKVEATIAAVRERLEAGEKVVVFTSYTAVVEALAAALGPAAVTITGSHNAAERQQAADALQRDPATTVLIGNLQAAGVGLTLTAATHVIFNDLDWVPGNHWQAEDRIYRIGQTRPAFITYLYAADTLDDFVAGLLEWKAQQIGVLEEAAADQASLLQRVIDRIAAGAGPERLTPAGTSRTIPATEAPHDPAAPSAERSVGLLGETLDLLARMRRGLGAIEPTEREFRVPSTSNPGEVNLVTVSHGIARCSCRGFQFRGNCSHAKAVIAQLARGAAD